MGPNMEICKIFMVPVHCGIALNKLANQPVKDSAHLKEFNAVTYKKFMCTDQAAHKSPVTTYHNACTLAD